MHTFENKNVGWLVDRTVLNNLDAYHNSKIP